MFNISSECWLHMYKLELWVTPGRQDSHELHRRRPGASPSESFPVHSRMLPRIDKIFCFPPSSVILVSLSDGLGHLLQPVKCFPDNSHAK